MMKIKLIIGCLLTIQNFLVACQISQTDIEAQATRFVTRIQTTPNASVEPSINLETDCPLSAMTTDQPPSGFASTFPAPGWYRNDDESLWAGPAPVGPVRVGEFKFAWFKPTKARLLVQGERLDANAPSLGSSIPEGYTGTFQSSFLIFPTEGCWEVNAEANESTLRFVLIVEPE